MNNKQFITFLKIYFFFYLIIFIHELGHALAIIILLHPNSLISIQIGLFEIINISKITFGLIPLGGVTTHNQYNIPAWQGIIISSAGILITLIVGIILIFILTLKLQQNSLFSEKKIFLTFKKIFVKTIFIKKDFLYLIYYQTPFYRLFWCASYFMFISFFNLLPFPFFDGWNILQNIIRLLTGN